MNDSGIELIKTNETESYIDEIINTLPYKIGDTAYFVFDYKKGKNPVYKEAWCVHGIIRGYSYKVDAKKHTMEVGYTIGLSSKPDCILDFGIYHSDKSVLITRVKPSNTFCIEDYYLLGNFTLLELAILDHLHKIKDVKEYQNIVHKYFS